MKNLLTAVFMILAFEAKADLIKTNYNYLNTQNLQRVQFSNIDEASGKATYFSYAQEKYVDVNFADYSRETFDSINGVKQNDVVLFKVGESLKLCKVWYLFENGVASIGCISGKQYINEIGLYNAVIQGHSAHSEDLIKTVNGPLEGVSVNEKFRLTKAVGDLEKGDKVRVEHLFENGYAMIQKVGLNLIDISDPLRKTKVQAIDLKDLTAK
jgi:hypothetical protein